MVCCHTLLQYSLSWTIDPATFSWAHTSPFSLELILAGIFRSSLAPSVIRVGRNEGRDDFFQQPVETCFVGVNHAHFEVHHDSFWCECVDTVMLDCILHCLQWFQVLYMDFFFGKRYCYMDSALPARRRRAITVNICAKILGNGLKAPSSHTVVQCTAELRKLEFIELIRPLLLELLAQESLLIEI